MEKIDVVFIILALGGIFSLINVEFLNVTGEVVNECIDSDNGIEPYVGGNLIGFDESTKRDFCKDETILNEYFCDGPRSNGEIKEFDCFYGCKSEYGKGFCLRTRKLSEEELEIGKCSNGCYYRGVCLNVETRTKDGVFCDIDEELKWQVFDGEECYNNYECVSNLCVGRKCVSEEVFNKFVESISG